MAVAIGLTRRSAALTENACLVHGKNATLIARSYMCFNNPGPLTPSRTGQRPRSVPFQRQVPCSHFVPVRPAD